ncbi:FliM/FliN family flagellar motor C-terminal domain-containing protein [Sphingosinicella sp.]|uniref:FliM/FliN family flagellar motor C-terminal domain-containing protein n=1 Tax=Sphingosinicella sp. TaxID=1917971 RepID=UPI004037DBC8
MNGRVMSFPDRKPRAWLPGEALDRADLDKELCAVLQHWSRKWFAGAPWRAHARLSRESPPDVDELRWSALSDGIAMGTASDAVCTIANAMLGNSPVQVFNEPNDLALAEGLANACLDDLKRRLVQLFRLPVDRGWGEGAFAELLRDEPIHSIAIGAAAGQPVMRLAVTQDLLIAWIKSGASSLPQPIMLGALGDGLERQMIEISARVGGCELSLTELEALGVGDVIILDRMLDGPLELALDGRPTGRACAVDQAENRLALELFEPLVG